MSILALICLFGVTVLAGCDKAGRDYDAEEDDDDDDEETYKVDYNGQKSFYKHARNSYRAGEKVKVYYYMIATDTDYSFYLDDEFLSCKYNDSKGFVIEFTMPDHDVSLRCEARESMYFTYDPEEALPTKPVDEPSETNENVLHYADISINESRENWNLIVLDKQEVVIVHPEDTDLIKQYGLSEDLDGYDYEMVDLPDDGLILYANKTTTLFTVYEYNDEGNISGAKQITGDEFVDYVLEHDNRLFVTYTLSEDKSEILTITEQYMP